MKRYGYLDMDENYSDVADWHVKAICPHCERKWYAPREEAWKENDVWYADDMCSEYEDDRPKRNNEW